MTDALVQTFYRLVLHDHLGQTVEWIASDGTPTLSTWHATAFPSRECALLTLRNTHRHLAIAGHAGWHIQQIKGNR